MNRKNRVLMAMICIFSMFVSANLCAQSDKFRIGISTWSEYPDSIKGFKEGLAEDGLMEGKDVEFVIEKSDGDKDKQKELAERFKKEKFNLVYSLTTPGTVILKEVLPPTTPIVFSIVSFPVEVGLIKSFERSETNLVGTSNFVDPHHFVQLLKTLLPGAKTAAIFRRTNEPNSAKQRDKIAPLLLKEGIQIVDLDGKTADELREKALQNADKVNVFITTQDTLIQGGGEEAIIKVAAEKKIPVLSSNKAGIEKGSAFGPVADFYTIGKMAGKMAAKILKEKVNPSQMASAKQDPPVMLINKKTVQTLGIAIPEGKLTNLKYVE